MNKRTERTETLTIDECAERLGIGRNTAYDLAAQGVIPVLRLGRRMVVPRVALERLLSEAGTRPAVPVT